MELIIYTTNLVEPKSPFGEFTGTCAVCGKQMDAPQYSGDSKGVCGRCFKASFMEKWLLERRANPGRLCIINRRLYTIDNDNVAGERGNCGRKFFIRFKNNPDQLIATRNLWFNGDAPRLDPRFVDDAEFVSEEDARESLQDAVK